MRIGKAFALTTLLALILSACFLPCLSFRITYGRGPLGNPNQYKIVAGMTPDDVLAIAGRPHERFDGDRGERWIYYLDCLGTYSLGVQFDERGRVAYVWT